MISHNDTGQPSQRARLDCAAATAAQTKTKTATAHTAPPARLKTAQAFIRVRPLLPAEIATGTTVLPGLVIDGDCPPRPEEEQSAVIAAAGVNALNSKTTPIGGFTGVFGQHDDNVVVFARAFLPRLPTVLRGGTASLFCYGYTGAGKTHTVFGYEGEPGMFTLAAAELIHLLDDWNEQHPSRDPVMLQVSCAEIYQDDVFDLLNGRAPCSLRKNSTGQLMVRGGTTKRMLTAAESEELGGDIEFVVQTESQHALVVRTPEYLADVHTLCSAHRAVGSSSTHDLSSRSHVIFRIDVVSEALFEVQERVKELESIKPGLERLYSKKTSNLDYETRANQKLRLRKKIRAVEAQLEEDRACITNMINHGAEVVKSANAFERSPLGGRLILVDLAGNDSDTRTVGQGGHTREQQRESNGINTSLLALKECLRGLSKSKGGGGANNKLPFRNSSMTRLLEEVLVPQSGRDSETVMLVNVAPGAQLGKKTINSLRYGQMFAKNKKNSNSVRKRGGGSRRGRGGGGGGGLSVRERLSLRSRLSSASEPVAPRTSDSTKFRTQGDDFDASDD